MKYLILTITLLFFSFTLIGCSSQPEQGSVQLDSSKDLYTCGMHPNVIQEGPGTCPICGMYLTPLNNSTVDHSDGTIEIDPVTVQNIGVKTAMVMRKDIDRSIRALGKVEYNESMVGNVQIKYSGWVEKVYFNKTGQKVSKGDVLLEIYSPKLITAQQEYIDLLNRKTEVDNNTAMIAVKNLNANIAAARERLINYDVSEFQIRDIEESTKVFRTVKVVSPYGGIIEAKHVDEGMQVMPNMKLYSINDIKDVWVIADIYENDAQLIRTGLKAEMELSNSPGVKFSGKVEYLYPYLNNMTRTAQVRLIFTNTKNVLKPGMYANVYVKTAPLKNVLAVPSEAVIFSGEKNLVIIDEGDGSFKPQEVAVGVLSVDGYYEVLDGLKEHDIVVTSSQFLLDSESRLQTSIKNMLSSSKTDHSQHIH